MTQSFVTLKSPVPNVHGLSPPSAFPQNPRLIVSHCLPILRPIHSFFCSSRGLEISVPECSSSNYSSLRSADGKLRSVGVKDVDVATLGNLCVDIVLNVPSLPPAKIEDRKAYLETLSASPPDKRFWEAGGNCNMAIAAARLGLHCIAIGHVGDEIYGKFLTDVLHNEGIDMVGMNEDVSEDSASYETLLCWVLVDPFQRHGFCSRADFSEDPAFGWITKLSGEVKMAIKRSKVLFCNGYDFDELSPSLIISTIDYAVETGTSILFDPGPRGKNLANGTPDERRALSQFLTMSDVLLLTSDEAESLTGINNPIAAGQELLKRSLRTKWVIIKMGARGSILITESSISCAPAFKVNIIDTVGCGDSFVAAVAFGYIHNLPMIDTLALANAVGAATAMGCGAGRNVATLEQVVELMRESNLNETEDFWDELADGNVHAREVKLLSKLVVNGSKKKLAHVPLPKVVSELLLKLKHVQIAEKV